MPDPCGAQQAIQGYAPVFRYDDDFSFLADPARRTDPIDVFKYAPLPVAPGAFLTFGLDDRERVETSGNAQLGFGYKPAQVYDLHRLLVDADLHIDDARVFVQLGSELEDGRRPGPIPTDVDRLDVQQGFTDYKLAVGLGELVLRTGRQEMAFDEGAIIGLRDGPNIRLSFDGVRASYVDATYALDAFAVRPVNVSPGAFDDGDLAGQAIYGIHATVASKAVPALAVDAFVFGNTMPAVSLYPTTEPEQTATFGTRWRLSSGGFDGAVGAIGQTGSYGGRDVLAYAAHANAGYTFRDLPAAPGFTLRADVLSGSDDPGHGTVHTFNALYPNVAYSTEATIEAPANLMEPALLLFAQPLADVRVQYIVEGLWRYSTADAFYAAPLIPLVAGNASTARFIGLEQQLSATWQLSEHVAVTSAYVHFVAGDFVVRGGGRDEDFGMTEVSFRFEDHPMGSMIDGRWRKGGDGAPTERGAFVRPPTTFREVIGSDRFPAQAGRYHLYVSLACPWAHRTLIFRKLKGLESLVGLSVTHWLMGEEGWTFEPAPGVVPDPLGADRLFEIYARADPQFTGRASVPILWDREEGTIVNNESGEIIRIFNSAFDDLGAATGDYYPEALRDEIDALNERIYDDVNNGVYKAGFATTQQAHREAVTRLFATLDSLNARLSRQRFLVGDRPTEADWRLFTTLVRFDSVYHGHFKCNLKRLVDYPALWDHTRTLYAMPGVAETVDFMHIKQHYFLSHPWLDPTGIVPEGPLLDWSAPTGPQRQPLRAEVAP